MGCAICKKAFGNYCFNRIIEGEMHQICYGCVVKIMEQQDKRIAALEAERDKLAFYLRGRTQERDNYRRWLSEAKRDTRPTELEWNKYSTAHIGGWVFQTCRELAGKWWLGVYGPCGIQTRLDLYVPKDVARLEADKIARALGLLREEETSDEKS